MGGDGGTTATQRRFIRGYKNPEDKEESKNVKEQQRMRTQSCFFSSSRLIAPVVACELGNLYTKELILTALVEKTLGEIPGLSHIRGLKDLKTLSFTSNPDYDVSLESGGTYVAEYICPVTQLEFNGIFPFVVIWSTGKVLSEKAVREIGLEGLQAEYGPFEAIDIVRLLPVAEEEIAANRSAMDQRRAIAAQKKREKDEKKDGGSKRKREAVANDAVLAPASERERSAVSGAVAGGGSVSSMKAESSSQAKKITSASALARSALAEVARLESSQSGVFKKLFHKDQEAEKKDRDLFMSVAGLRYTIS